MSVGDNPGVVDVARAIVAGQAIDWAAIESSAEVSDSAAVLLRELKVIEEIAEVYRSFSAVDSIQTDAASTPAAATATVPIGAAWPWGPLQVLEAVGHGAFGDVYRAWDPRLDREVALKLMKRAESKHTSVDSLIVEEGRHLARVRHPNIVTVYGADRIDGRVGLWMEFVRGRTLEAILREHGTFGSREAALIGLDVCRALSAVHRAGLVHRDIKAQNVVRESGGRIVLMDFGAGYDAGASPGGGPIAGTPVYLAPEVFRGSLSDSRSDIYSVGVLLFHLVSGSYPVTGRSVADMREAHRQQRRSWLRDERPDLPDVFVQVVERALDSDPQRRYESAGAMEAALARVVSASDPESVATTTEAPAPAPRRFGIAWIAAAPIVAAVLGFTGWRIVSVAPSMPPWSQNGAVGTGLASPIVARQVSLPDFDLVGSPSPDGTLFSAIDNAGNVVVFDLSAARTSVVTHDANYGPRASQSAGFPVISPDNQFIAYSWNALDGKSEMRLIDIAGREPRVLVRKESIAWAAPVVWSHDGNSVLSLLTYSNKSHQLALVSADDGSIKTIKDLGEASPQYASISPDGEFVVYDAPQQTSAARDIFIVRRDGSDSRLLITHPANDTNPVWAPDGRSVLFTSDRSGNVDLWSVAIENGFVRGEPEVLRRNIGRMMFRGLTDKGSYFYFQTVGAVDVYQSRIDGDRLVDPVAVPTMAAGSNISSVFSPDGRRLAYASRRGLAWFDLRSTTLGIRDLETGQQQDLTPSMHAFLVRSWSPDGRYVLIQGQGVTHGRGAYRVDAETGRVTPAIVDDEIARPDWLPDGRIMYLSRSKEQVIVRDLQTGAEEVLLDGRLDHVRLVANVAGRGYKLSPDGQTLAFTVATQKGDNRPSTIWIKVRGVPSRELVSGSERDSFQLQDWTPDGTAILCTCSVSTADKPGLCRVPISGGYQFIGLSNLVGVRDVSVHPDGSRITFTAGWPTNELWALENVLPEKGKQR